MEKSVASQIKMRNTLFLASAVRSGSTYIAEEIAYRLQRDAGFQFFDLTRDRFSHLRDATTAAEILKIYGNLYLDKSGWATSKIHCAALSIITREARRDATVQKAFFGPMSRWIVVRRRDRVAQAVSLAVAKKSGRWHVYARSGSREQSKREIAFRDVEVALRSILMDDVYLEAFSRGIAPQRIITLDYEDVVASGRTAAAAVIRLCGLRMKLKKDKGKQVAKIVRTERITKTKLAGGFSTWLAENYHETQAPVLTDSVTQSAQDTASPGPRATGAETQSPGATESVGLSAQDTTTSVPAGTGTAS